MNSFIATIFLSLGNAKQQWSHVQGMIHGDASSATSESTAASNPASSM
jgi:hypothetical protein